MESKKKKVKTTYLKCLILCFQIWLIVWFRIEFWVRNQFPWDIWRHLFIAFYLLMALLRILMWFLLLPLCGCSVDVFILWKLSGSFLYTQFWSLRVMDVVLHYLDTPSGLQDFPSLRMLPWPCAVSLLWRLPWLKKISGASPHPITDNIVIWRPRSLTSADKNSEGHPSARALWVVSWGLHWACIRAQLLPLPKPVSFPFPSCHRRWSQ